MEMQPSDTSSTGMAWSIVTSGPYMDMLLNVSLSVAVTNLYAGLTTRLDTS